MSDRLFKTVREAQLEFENEQLKAKLHHLESKYGLNNLEQSLTYAMCMDPKTIDLRSPGLPETLSLAGYGSYSAKNNGVDGSYHVYAMTMLGKPAYDRSVGYYISNYSLLTDKYDRAELLRSLMEKITRQLMKDVS